MGLFENYTSPWLNDELRILEDAARKFFETEFLPKNEAWHEAGVVDRDAWNQAGEAGLLCAEMPVEYGGGGGDYRHETVITEQQLYAGIGGFGNQVHSQIVAPYILNYGDEDQKQRWLPRMASGEMVGAIAMTEPNTGSDLQSVRTTAIQDGDEYVINGAKTYITNGQLCDLVIVVAKTDPHAGWPWYLLGRCRDRHPGVQAGAQPDKAGREVCGHLRDVLRRLPRARGKPPGRGGRPRFVQLMQQLPQERLNIAQAAVVNMERAIETTLAFVKERKAFGQRVLDFQNTRFTLAECKTQALVARTFVDQLVVKHLDGALDASTASMAKYWCTDIENDIVDECLQLHGGAGYMDEYPISRMYADIKGAKDLRRHERDHEGANRPHPRRLNEVSASGQRGQGLRVKATEKM